jgi:osmotically-inducible protein OsmY
VVFLAPGSSWGRTLLGLTLICAVAGCATYRKCGFAGCPGDAKITHNVQTLMSKYPALQPPNLIRVETTDHVVYLYGEVDTELERSTAESVARAVPGVTRVVDSISFEYSGR